MSRTWRRYDTRLQCRGWTWWFNLYTQLGRQLKATLSPKLISTIPRDKIYFNARIIIINSCGRKTRRPSPASYLTIVKLKKHQRWKQYVFYCLCVSIWFFKSFWCISCSQLIWIKLAIMNCDRTARRHIVKPKFKVCTARETFIIRKTSTIPRISWS